MIEQQEQDGSKHQPITIQDDQLSPEVKILGERAFIDSCYNMAKDTYVLYNTNLTLGSSSSSRSKENIPPKRIVNPSTFECSPYGNYDRGPLMSHERKAYANIMLLSKIEPHRSAWAVLIDNTRVSLGQLGDSFSEDGWVEAYVINVFCRILFRDRHPRQSKKHCFFTTVSDYFLEKWRNEGARKMMRSRALASFDGAGKALPLHECDRIQNFINTWEESKLRRMGFKNFGIAYPNLPKQVGSDACGIFVMKRMQTWDSRNPTHSDFKMKDVQDARVRFAVDILFSLHNSIQEVKKLIKNS